ncbi:alpha/beta hydrolase [Clostridium saccharoperbutylacetonicum]|nr:alpha/beta fold hydrolase [Clostridium saccharoperbutylacetonicum]
MRGMVVNMKNNVDFNSGEYQLHSNPNFNYQLNRTYNVSNGNLDEILELAKKITDIKVWEKEMMVLAKKALKEERIKDAIAYFRMTEFFMYDGNPDKIKTYDKAIELFYKYHEELFQSGILKFDRVPYDQGYLPVIHAVPEGECIDTILIHGGFDSYMEEFLPSLLYLRENGFDVYLFEGPGQGNVLRKQGITFSIKWERPVKALLDYYNLNDVTIIGISMGAILAPRAAAFENRIKRVVAWSVCVNMFELLLDAIPTAEQEVLKELLGQNDKDTINNIMYNQMEKEPLIDWAMHHGFYNMGVNNPYDYMLAANKYEYRDVADRITQDFMLLGAEKDHLIRIEKYKDAIDSLKNVKSLTYRMFTEKENAASHCNTGNPKLVLDTIISWIKIIKNREK